MTATVLDDRRRLVMPLGFKPKSAVTVQVLDDETVLVKLVKPSSAKMVMLLPDVIRLPEDTEWEKVEAAFTKASIKGLTPPEE